MLRRGKTRWVTRQNPSTPLLFLRQENFIGGKFRSSKAKNWTFLMIPQFD